MSMPASRFLKGSSDTLLPVPQLGRSVRVCVCACWGGGGGATST